jgi:hypothetical protein
MNAIKWCAVYATVLLGGCANTGITSATGSGVFYQSSVEPVLATGEVLRKGAGTGVACAHNVLGAVVVGDASVDQAKQRAGIQEVVTVDRLYERFFLFYGKSCTIVRGN